MNETERNPQLPDKKAMSWAVANSASGGVVPRGGGHAPCSSGSALAYPHTPIPMGRRASGEEANASDERANAPPPPITTAAAAGRTPRSPCAVATAPPPLLRTRAPDWPLHLPLPTPHPTAMIGRASRPCIAARRGLLRFCASSSLLSAARHIIAENNLPRSSLIVASLRCLSARAAAPAPIPAPTLARHPRRVARRRGAPPRPREDPPTARTRPPACAGASAPRPPLPALPAPATTARPPAQ